MSNKAMGVSRMSDNEKAILVHFTRRLTDDELRDLHELLAGRARKSATAPRNDAKLIAEVLTAEPYSDYEYVAQNKAVEQERAAKYARAVAYEVLRRYVGEKS